MTQDKPCPVRFLALTTHEGALYGVSKAGHLTPLYVYGPLADAYAAPAPYRIAFAPDWPDYARNFVLEYLPFPELSADQIPDDLEAKITVQERTGDRKRPWTQTQYNGWPLYFARNEAQGQRAGSQPLMFLPATVDMPSPQDMNVQLSPDAAGLLAQDTGGGNATDVGYPGPYLGP
jgi:hypothetical protein